MLSHKYNIIDHDDAVVQSYAAVAPANLSVEVDEKNPGNCPANCKCLWIENYIAIYSGDR